MDENSNGSDGGVHHRRAGGMLKRRSSDCEGKLFQYQQMYRDSILKIRQTDDDTDGATETMNLTLGRGFGDHRKSRRVSFADTNDVREFVKDIPLNGPASCSALISSVVDSNINQNVNPVVTNSQIEMQRSSSNGLYDMNNVTAPSIADKPRARTENSTAQVEQKRALPLKQHQSSENSQVTGSIAQSTGVVKLSSDAVRQKDMRRGPLEDLPQSSVPDTVKVVSYEKKNYVSDLNKSVIMDDVFDSTDESVQENCADNEKGKMTEYERSDPAVNLLSASGDGVQEPARRLDMTVRCSDDMDLTQCIFDDIFVNDDIQRNVLPSKSFLPDLSLNLDNTYVQTNLLTGKSFLPDLSLNLDNTYVQTNVLTGKSFLPDLSLNLDITNLEAEGDQLNHAECNVGGQRNELNAKNNVTKNANETVGSLKPDPISVKMNKMSATVVCDVDMDLTDISDPQNTVALPREEFCQNLLSMLDKSPARPYNRTMVGGEMDLTEVYRETDETTRVIPTLCPDLSLLLKSDEQDECNIEPRFADPQLSEREKNGGDSLKQQNEEQINDDMDITECFTADISVHVEERSKTAPATQATNKYVTESKNTFTSEAGNQTLPGLCKSSNDISMTAHVDRSHAADTTREDDRFVPNLTMMMEKSERFQPVKLSETPCLVNKSSVALETRACLRNAEETFSRRQAIVDDFHGIFKDADLDKGIKYKSFNDSTIAVHHMPAKNRTISELSKSNYDLSLTNVTQNVAENQSSNFPCVNHKSAANRSDLNSTDYKDYNFSRSINKSIFDVTAADTQEVRSSEIAMNPCNLDATKLEVTDAEIAVGRDADNTHDFRRPPCVTPLSSLSRPFAAMNDNDMTDILAKSTAVVDQQELSRLKSGIGLKSTEDNLATKLPPGINDLTLGDIRLPALDELEFVDDYDYPVFGGVEAENGSKIEKCSESVVKPNDLNTSNMTACTKSVLNIEVQRSSETGSKLGRGNESMRQSSDLNDISVKNMKTPEVQRDHENEPSASAESKVSSDSVASANMKIDNDKYSNVEATSRDVCASASMSGNAECRVTSQNTSAIDTQQNNNDTEVRMNSEQKENRIVVSNESDMMTSLDVVPECSVVQNVSNAIDEKSACISIDQADNTNDLLSDYNLATSAEKSAGYDDECMKISAEDDSGNTVRMEIQIDAKALENPSVLSAPTQEEQCQEEGQQGNVSVHDNAVHSLSNERTDTDVTNKIEYDAETESVLKHRRFLSEIKKVCEPYNCWYDRREECEEADCSVMIFKFLFGAIDLRVKIERELEGQLCCDYPARTVQDVRLTNHLNKKSNPECLLVGRLIEGEFSADICAQLCPDTSHITKLTAVMLSQLHPCFIERPSPQPPTRYQAALMTRTYQLLEYMNDLVKSCDSVRQQLISFSSLRYSSRLHIEQRRITIKFSSYSQMYHFYVSADVSLAHMMQNGLQWSVEIKFADFKEGDVREMIDEVEGGEDHVVRVLRRVEQWLHSAPTSSMDQILNKLSTGITAFVPPCASKC